jgi:hypothetical protein
LAHCQRHPAIEGEVVSLDGASLGKAVWGTPVAIDPGPHELRAVAPGRKPWTATVTLAAAERKTAAVPVLEAEQPSPLPGPAASAPAQPAQPTLPASPPGSSGTEHGNHTLGWVVGGAGVAAIGVGAFFGVRAISKRHESDGQCPTDITCSPEGVTLNQQATTAAWVSNIGVGTGLVAVVAGVWLLTRSSKASDNPAHAALPVSVGANVAPTGGELNIAGRW